MKLKKLKELKCRHEADHIPPEGWTGGQFLTGKCVTVGAFCYFVIFPIMYIFSYLSYTYLNIKFTCLKGKDP